MSPLVIAEKARPVGEPAVEMQQTCQPLKVRQSDIDLALARGLCTIEVRINAEDPAQGFRPAPGRIARWALPSGAGLRFDTHVEEGYVVPPHYDSLLCKAIATGATRDEAADRLVAALRAIEVEGVPTTIPLHVQILSSPEFRANRYDTRTIPGWSAGEHA